MLTRLFMELRLRKQADYGSISLVTLNMGVAGTWVFDPLERPRVNYSQSMHPYIYPLFTFILYNPPLFLSLCLSNTTACTVQGAPFLFTPYQKYTQL